MTILAVDPGTTLGWACSDGESGKLELGRGHTIPESRFHKLPEPERHGLLAARFEHWLESEISRRQPSFLVIERQMTHHRSHLLLGLRMVALLIGWKRRLQVEEVWEAQWKPWAKACGWWEKSDELDARAMLGWWQENRLPLLQREGS